MFLNFPLQAIAAKTTSSIVEISLQIFRTTRRFTNSHQTFTRHQSIILPCDDTKTAPSNSQTFRAATKQYIVRYKERLLRKLALSCSISSTKVLLCLENFIPPATLRSHPRKYRNERVGGSLRQQWTRVPRVRESLRATSFVRGIYERRDEGCKHPTSLVARVSSAGRRSRKIRTEDAITNFPRFYWFSILLLCFFLSPPPFESFLVFPSSEGESVCFCWRAEYQSDWPTVELRRKKALFTPCRVRSRAKIIDADSLRPEAKDVPLSDRA